MGHDVLKEVIVVDSSRIRAEEIWSVLKIDHFLLFRVGQSTELLADNYMRKIVQLHGIPVIIVSDRDGGFRSQFR